MDFIKNGLIIIATVLVTIFILETRRLTQLSSLLSPVPNEEHFLPHTRQRREALTSVTEYDVDVELNVTNTETVDYLRQLLQSGNFSLTLGPSTNLTHINMTTVCVQNGSSFQCRCEDQFVWSYNSCMTYRACDEIINDSCTCISTIPSNGEYCRPKNDATTGFDSTTPTPVVTTFMTTVSEMNTRTPTTVPPTNATTVLNSTTPNSTTLSTDATTGFDSTTPTPVVTTFMTTVSDTTIYATTEMNTRTPTTVPPTNATKVLNSTTPNSTTLSTDTTPNATTEMNTSTTTPVTDSTTVLNTTAVSPTAPTTQISQTTSTTSGTSVSTTTAPGATTSTSTTAATTQERTTASTTTSTTATGSTTTTPPTGLKLSMSLKLDKQYTPGLSNPSNSEFQNLEAQVLPVLKGQYSTITGFIGVTINAFKQGSIVVDFVVEATHFDPKEVATANGRLPEAMKVVAPVIGSVTVSFTEFTPIYIPSLTYTGQSMNLRCGPPATSNVSVGQISGAKWKFKGQIVGGGRYNISTGNSGSNLTVNNVILADIGLYECTLKGSNLNYIQNGTVTTSNIVQAPNIRLPSVINAACVNGGKEILTCCVQSVYTVQWDNNGANSISEPSTVAGENCIQHTYVMKNCNDTEKTVVFTCRANTLIDYHRTTNLILFPGTPKCTNNTLYGSGRLGDKSIIACDKGQVGNKTAVCKSTGQWRLEANTCIVEEIKELLIESENLNAVEVPNFAEKLSQVVENQQVNISNSSTTILAIVGIMNTISNVTTVVTEPVMTSVLKTFDILTGDEAKESWKVLNTELSSKASSSQLLGALEHLSEGLVGKFTISTERILLNRTTFDNYFSTNLNSSITIEIPDVPMTNVNITTIAFSSLNNIMPVRDSSLNGGLLDSTSNKINLDSFINAGVVLVKVDTKINNVTLTFKKRNNSLTQPQCVFWNFLLFNWDQDGCMFVSDINETVTCSCTHLTSFSILMSTQILTSIEKLLDYITYIGVGISLGSLVICLVIEGYVWKAITKNSTAFMRHVSIINTALCLLIADICFMIAASFTKGSSLPVGPCSTVTFFMHFFYLALFFWMLVSGLLLFYRTVMVFSQMSKSTMLAIGLCLGYGAPLIIAVVTIAATATRNEYISDKVCWLNWDKSRALLALVIPALIIVCINIIILFVVLYKMLRRGGIKISSQAEEKNTMKVIVRCVLVLTPLFGLTWSLGVGTMVAPEKEGIHIAFAFFNSLQGLFILIFGTLFDSKIRSILSKKMPTSTSGSSWNQTRSTSESTFSAFLGILPGRRNVYHLSQASSTSSNYTVESFTSI